MMKYRQPCVDAALEYVRRGAPSPPWSAVSQRYYAPGRRRMPRVLTAVRRRDAIPVWETFRATREASEAAQSVEATRQDQGGEACRRSRQRYF